MARYKKNGLSIVKDMLRDKKDIVISHKLNVVQALSE